jgi:hypothetical protein
VRHAAYLLLATVVLAGLGVPLVALLLVAAIGYAAWQGARFIFRHRVKLLTAARWFVGLVGRGLSALLGIASLLYCRLLRPLAGGAVRLAAGSIRAVRTWCSRYGRQVASTAGEVVCGSLVGGVFGLAIGCSHGSLGASIPIGCGLGALLALGAVLAQRRVSPYDVGGDATELGFGSRS